MTTITGKRPTKKQYDSSVWVLIGANLIPLVGVFLWDWSIFEVVVLYWLENVIIGGINILKMLTCSPDPNLLKSMFGEQVAERAKFTEHESQEIKQAREMLGNFGDKAGAINHGSKLFIIPFFTVHYGMFCLAHGVFVFVLLGGEGLGSGSGFGSPSVIAKEALAQGGIWATLGLALSHLFSFATNYIGKGEYRRISTPQLMAAPYGRIVVLHVAILFGAFAITALGSPLSLLVLLIVGKIALDLKLHFRSHRKLSLKTDQASL